MHALVGCDRTRGCIRLHTWGTLDVVKSELGNSWVELQEERQRLANTTGSTEDGNLGGLQDISPC